MNEHDERRGPGATPAMRWALLGVSLLFATAAGRLGARGIATLRHGLGADEWIALAVLTAAFVYGEGVRALQRRWVPHMLRRTARLRDEPSVLVRALAPLYALSLIRAPRPLLLRAWAGLFAIALAVLLVRALPEPWRGITDFAVAAALAWGLLAIAAGVARTFG